MKEPDENECAHEQVSFYPATYTGRYYGVGAFIMPVIVMVAVLGELLGGLSYPMLFGILVLCWISGVIVLGIISRVRNRALQPREASTRLRCYGDYRDWPIVESISNEFFEPLIVHTTSAFRGSVPRLKRRLLMLAVVATVLLLIYLTSQTTLVVAGLIVLSLVARVLFKHLFPLYYRVVPGRLDILRYKPLSDAVADRQSIALGDAEIECRFNRYVLTVAQREDDAEPFRISLVLIPDARNFARTIFQAAMCREPSPVLPGDDLLG